MRQRKSPRRQDYDYTSAGMYFITVCTQGRQHLFGEIQYGKMLLSEIGRICDQEIYKTEILRRYIDMHAYVVMPNHIHLLMYIDTPGDDREMNDVLMNSVGTHDVGTHGNASNNSNIYNPTNKDRLPSVPTNPIVTLGSIIRNIKSSVTKYANKYSIPFGRQGRYHDHVVRTEQDYDRIKYYIEENIHNREDDAMYKKNNTLMI